MTDSHPAYRLIREDLPHETISHEVAYVDGRFTPRGLKTTGRC